MLQSAFRLSAEVPQGSVRLLPHAHALFRDVTKVSLQVKWVALANIAASWFASPVLSGFVSGAIFCLLRKSILESSKPLEQGLHILPLAYGLTVAINVISVAHDGPKRK